mgnify:CR=1 FL=1
MLNFRQIVLNIYDKVKKVLFVAITCLVMISMFMAPKTVKKKVFLSEEDARINLALDHNQCLSYGYIPNTYEYLNCMEKLHKQQQSTTAI